MTARDLKAGRLVDLFPELRASATGFNEAIWIVYPSRRCLRLKVRAFFAFLKAEVSAPTRG